MTGDIQRHLDARIREIGLDLFERAAEAMPRPWQKAWWLEQVTQFVERDARFKTGAYEFVECLPALRDDAAIARHLFEYLDPAHVPMPATLHRLMGPGPLQSFRESVIGWVARLGAKQMAGRFIAGHDPRSALRTIERLRNQGMTFTLDVLGEFITSPAQADRYVQAYVDLIEQITPVANAWSPCPILDEDADGPMPRVNLSIKLTSLDPFFDAIDPARSIEKVGARLRPLLRTARRAGVFVNVDMESTQYRRLTLDLFKSVMMEDEFRDWSDVGIVVQAYLTDAERDLGELIEWRKKRGYRFAIRLVKGAYWDAETAAAARARKTPPVWMRKWESDACFERMTRTMLARAADIRPTFASHNVRTLAFVLAEAERLRLSPKQYELQNLYGMGDPLKAAVVGAGRCLRVYLPCGALMPGMGYLIRRLLENSSNEGFLKQAFTERASHERLLLDPAAARPSSAAPPTRRYRDTVPEDSMSSFVNASNTSFTSEDNRRKMIGAIEYVRGEFGRDYPLIIGGESVSTDVRHDSVNPAKPSEVVGRVCLASTADADRAVAAAYKAFREWRTTSASDRAALLRKLADRLEMRRFEFAAGMILECGKPWREADGDVTEAIDHCRYYAEQIERIESHPRRRDLPGEENVLIYSPKGVVAVISPWAFPLAIMGGMSAAALAAGNTVVIKPARHASVTAAKFVQVCQDVGFPPGVVNFLPGEGAAVGAHLVEHADVQVVAFTGSDVVGMAVLQSGARVRPGQAYIKKMIVEMGGHNAIIIDDDANLDRAVQAVIDSAFVQAGQKCSSCSRAVVLAGVYDSFCARIVEAARCVPIGPAEAPATVVGPLIEKEEMERVNRHIERATAEARLLHRGELPPECEGGYFVPPTIIADVDPSSSLAGNEIFGPVLSIMRAADFDEAIDIANRTRYALTGGLFSRSPAHIERARRDFAVGNLYINRRIIGSQVDAQPFGGFKLSGTGVKAGSPDYLLHYMDARCITENTLRSGLVPDESQTHLA